MTDSSAGIPDNITRAFENLKAAAQDLNAASDTLATPITWLDESIRRLNLGIPAWKEFKRETHPDSDDYWAVEIGYAKVNSKWGIALRTISGHPSWSQDDVETWLFNDAPRHLRVLAVDHLPLVIEALIEEARATAESITKKIGQAQEYARAIRVPMPPPAGRK